MNGEELMAKALEAFANKDVKTAHMYLQKAAEEGSADAMGTLAEGYLLHQNDGANAFMWAEKAAAKDSPRGTTILGICYMRGEGTEKDEEKAEYWLQRAAELGDSKGPRYLGMLYEAGINGVPDPEKAVLYYRMAAERDDITGEYQLGRCYEEGIAVKKNLEEAVFWYRKAAVRKDHVGKPANDALERLGIPAEEGTKAVSQEAQAAIDAMNVAKAEKTKRNASGDPMENLRKSIYAERQRNYEQGMAYQIPDEIELSEAIADTVHGDWLKLKNQKHPERVILFFHGGAYQTGSALSRRSLACRLAIASGIDVFIIDYRLAPEWKYPAGLTDCSTSFLWLIKQGYKPENIYVFGESAGAGLSLAMTLYLKDYRLPLPAAVCAFSPSAEMGVGLPSRITRSNRDPMIGTFFTREEEIAKMTAFERGEFKTTSFYCTPEESKLPYVSTAYGNFKGFPRLLLEEGTEEILYDDAQTVYRLAKEAGVDVTIHAWEGLFHVFALFDIPEAKEVLKEIAAFYNK